MKKPRISCRSRSERGQALILIVGSFTVVFVIAAIVIDLGLWMAERRSMQRAADLAAAAGAQDLLVEDWATVEPGVLAYVDKNGYTDGVDGVSVVVEPKCRNQDVCSNPATPGSDVCTPATDQCDSLVVTISKPGGLLFASVVGVGGPFSISAEAAAGVVPAGGGGVGGNPTGPDEIMILLDAASRMQNGCFSSPALCPMTLAKDEVNELVNFLLGGGGTNQVAFSGFTYCFEGSPPFPSPYELDNECITIAEESSLTSDAAMLASAVSATHAHSGAEANICLALYKSLLTFPNLSQPTVSGRAVILFSDGDNRYNHSTYFANNNYPPQSCRPDDPNENQPGHSDACSAGNPSDEELQLDLKTYLAAQSMKNVWDIEVVVVALNDPFWGCLNDDGNTMNTPGYCDGVGVDNAPDPVANQRLLKCMASSPDHYILVSQPELPGTADTLGTAERITIALGNRGLLQ